MLDFFARVAPAALALMVAVLAAFSLYGMSASRDAVEKTTKLTSTEAAFDQAGARLTREEHTLDRLEQAVEPATVAGLEESRAEFELALGRAIRAGDSRTRSTVEGLRDQHHAYTVAVDRMIAALRGGDERLSSRLQDLRVDRAYAPLLDGLRRASMEADLAATSELGVLDGLAHSLLAAASVVSGIALVLVCVLYVVFGVYRRREDRARRAEIARLEQAALTDNLTGLRNHRAFQEDLRTSLEGRDAAFPVTLVLFDLDGLKQTNDAYGHEAGDARLTAVADGLRDTLRGADAYRLGGDEFAAILLGEPTFSGLEYAHRLRAHLAEGQDAETSVTAGCAQADYDTPADIVLSRADAALLAAKRSHRGVLTWSLDIELDRAEAAGTADRHQVAVLATSLARAVDAKDSYTRSHCETVSELCVTMATGLRLSAEKVAKLRIAGLLHDVGKIGIPDAVLKKPGPLDRSEYELMQTHSQLGARILAGAELTEEAEWVLHHHERPDGLGYPDGLGLEEIPLESRIILVADAYEALTSDRPYRPGRSRSEAIAELERNAGTQFDPECVAVLRRELAGDSGESLPQPGGTGASRGRPQLLDSSR